ncbi:hypothetical protein DFJ74DRAFT_736755 [Hyaloraphidium curvatum]|nr:hypothetical protein DFJ74DRAFT_736755 [Hyaloraphidium curvatum]
MDRSTLPGDAVGCAYVRGLPGLPGLDSGWCLVRPDGSVWRLALDGGPWTRLAEPWDGASADWLPHMAHGWRSRAEEEFDLTVARPALDAFTSAPSDCNPQFVPLGTLAPPPPALPRARRPLPPPAVPLSRLPPSPPPAPPAPAPEAASGIVPGPDEGRRKKSEAKNPGRREREEKRMAKGEKEAIDRQQELVLAEQGQRPMERRRLHHHDRHVEDWQRKNEEDADRFAAEREATRLAEAQALREQLERFAPDAEDGVHTEKDLPDEIERAIKRRFLLPELLAVPLDGRIPAVESSRISPRDAIGSAVGGTVGAFVRRTADALVPRLQGVPVRKLVRALAELTSAADGAIGQENTAEGALAMGMARAVEEVLGERWMGQRAEGGEYAAAVAEHERQQRRRKSEQQAQKDREETRRREGGRR